LVALLSRAVLASPTGLETGPTKFKLAHRSSLQPEELSLTLDDVLVVPLDVDRLL